LCETFFWASPRRVHAERVAQMEAGHNQPIIIIKKV